MHAMISNMKTEMKLLLSLSLVFSLSFFCGAKPYSVLENSIWSDCTQKGDHGKIVDITVDPNPPKIGSDVSIIANITVDEDITGGMVTATLQVGPFPYQQKFDLCDLFTYVNITCPVKKGPLTLAIKTPIPKATPPGKYNGQATAVDQNGQRIFCLKINLDLS